MNKNSKKQNLTKTCISKHNNDEITNNYLPYLQDKNRYKIPYKKAAFTLAETLITIGIIGIVAAMTLPTLINNYRKHVLHNQLKKAYSDISQVNTKIIADGDNLLNYELSPAYPRANLIRSYFKAPWVIEPDTSWVTIQASIKKAYGGKRMLPVWSATYRINLSCDNGGLFADSNGRWWTFNDSDRQICVDINGKKGPNRYGYDFFIFYPDSETGQKIIPEKTSSLSDAYTTYTYYALYNIHPTDSTKDYWNDYIKNFK